MRNVHERVLPGAPETVAPLLDGLASRDDRLWPHEHWPPMRLDKGLQVGSRGGHGPIRYRVESYAPGRAVTFRFEGPRGFDGIHRFTVEAHLEGAILRHVIEMEAKGPARLTWPVVFRPLHDALVEDAFDKADVRFGGEATAHWSPYVHLLRWMLRR